MLDKEIGFLKNNDHSFLNVKLAKNEEGAKAPRSMLDLNPIIWVFLMIGAKAFHALSTASEPAIFPPKLGQKSLNALARF